MAIAKVTTRASGVPAAERRDVPHAMRRRPVTANARHHGARHLGTRPLGTRPLGTRHLGTRQTAWPAAARIGLALGLVAGSLVTPRPALGQQAVRRQVAIQAAATAILREASRVKTARDGDDRITKQLTGAMMSDLSSHRSIEDSQKLSREILRAETTKALEHVMEAKCKEAGDRIKAKIELSEVFRLLKTDPETLVREAVDEHVGAVGNKQFRTARAVAIADQSNRLGLAIEPPRQYEVENSIATWDAGADAFIETLARKLVDGVVNEDTILFEENENGALDKGREIARKIGQEYEQQKQLVLAQSTDEAVPADRLTREAIYAFTRAKLDAYVQGPDRRVPSQWGYETPFNVLAFQHDPEKPTIKAAPGGLAETRAADLELARFRRHCAEHPLPDLKDSVARRLPKWVADDADAHRTLAGSRDTIVAQMLPGARLLFIRDHFKSQGVPLRDDLAARFGELFDDQNQGAVVRKRLQDQLEQDLPEVRAAFAKMQVNDHFAFVRQWNPSETQTTQCVDSGYPSTYSQALTLLGKKPPAPTIDETEGLVRQAVVDQAKTWGDALNRQIEIVRMMERDNGSQLEMDVLAGGKKEDLLNQWVDDFEQRWAAERKRQGEKLPAAVPIFDRTRTTIMEKVSVHFTSILKAEEERKKKVKEDAEKEIKRKEQEALATAAAAARMVEVAKKRQEALAARIEGLAPVEVGGVNADLALVLENDGSSARCKATVPADPAFDVKFQAAEIDESVETLVAELLPLIKGLHARKVERWRASQGNADQSAGEFQFYLSEQSQNARHVMVLRLRRALERAWSELGASEPGYDIEFVWNEGE